jgi:hypothetical protein
VDGNKYCVREREKLELAADLLAKVTQKCKLLVIYMKEKYPKAEVLGHRDFPSVKKECPSFDVKKWLVAVGF